MYSNENCVCILFSDTSIEFRLPLSPPPASPAFPSKRDAQIQVLTQGCSIIFASKIERPNIPI